MAWFKKEHSVPEDQDRRKVKDPEGRWLKCNHCRAIVYRKEVERSARVCTKCEYHFPISVEERIDLLLDLGTFREWSAGLEPTDPLHFKDTQRYSDRLQAAQQSTGKRDAPEGRVGEDGDIRDACLGEAADGSRGFGHLHQRENSLLHPRPTRRGHQHQGDALAQGALGGMDYLLAHHRAHATAHEPEVKHAQNRPGAVDPPLPNHNGVLLAGALLGRLQAFAVALGVPEMQRVRRLQPGGPLAKGTQVQQQVDPFLNGDGKMVLTLRANPGAPLHFLAIHDRAAVVALEPEALGNLDLLAVLILRG